MATFDVQQLHVQLLVQLLDQLLVEMLISSSNTIYMIIYQEDEELRSTSTLTSVRGCLSPAKTALVVLAAAEFAMFVIAGKYDCTLPLHVPILGLIISFSLRKNLQLLSSGPGGGEKSVCDLQSMGWGGAAQDSTTIFGAVIQCWEVRPLLLLTWIQPSLSWKMSR